MTSTFYGKELSLAALANPAITQKAVLDRISRTLLNGDDITDPNNGFIYLLETTAQLTATYVSQALKEFSILYPSRATTPIEIYRHMSDFDYLAITSSPSQTNMRVVFDREYLYDNAVYYNENYHKLTIPQKTSFGIGGRLFSLYYPIDILINKQTGNFLVIYDTSVTNPLLGLTSNQVEFTLYEWSSIKYISIDFPVYQFSITEYSETPQLTSGFKKSYSYTDKFYAARLFYTKDGTEHEMRYTLSDDVYDPYYPTAKLTINNDSNTIDVAVPYVYFTKELLNSSKLRVQIYTTQGSLDIPISNTDIDTTRMYISDPVTAFTAPLLKTPTISVRPLDTQIIGGSNGMSFNVLRDAVITQSLHDQIPITPAQLENFGMRQGYSIIKPVDNITDRVYYATRKMLDSNNSEVPVTIGNIVIDNTVSQVSSVVKFIDNSVTIHPTTIYKYLSNSAQCIPLTDDEISDLAALTKEDLVNKLNTTRYLRFPFHTVLYAEDNYPVSKVFNLNNPKITSYIFEKENPSIAMQMIVRSGIVIHTVNSTGGYIIRLAVSKTSDMNNIPEANQYVILRTVDKAGANVYVRMTLLSQSNGIYIYDAYIPSTYQISKSGNFHSILQHDGISANCLLGLETEFTVHMLIDTAYSLGQQNDYGILSGLPNLFYSKFGLTRQKIKILFGEDLSKSIESKTAIIHGPKTYATFPEDIYQVYDKDIIELTSEGTIPQDPVTGMPIYNVLHARGDYVLDENGDKYIQHPAGSYILNQLGEPIELEDRFLRYFIESFMIDAIMYASESVNDTKFISGVSELLSNYCAPIQALNDSLLERTSAFFMPIKTIGNTKFSLGDDTVITLDLALSFAFKCYVTDAVSKDEARKTIMKNEIVKIVEDQVRQSVISMSTITKLIQDSYKSTIVSIDILGINNDPLLQTLINIDEKSKPMVAKKIKLDSDGTLSIVKDVTIDFVSERYMSKA